MRDEAPVLLDEVVHDGVPVPQSADCLLHLDELGPDEVLHGLLLLVVVVVVVVVAVLHQRHDVFVVGLHLSKVFGRRFLHNQSVFICSGQIALNCM